MPKVKFGVSAEEASRAKGGVREPPKPGLYAAKVVSIAWEEPANKDARFHVIFELLKTPDPLTAGYQIHTYLIPGNPNAEWKFHQFLMAAGLIGENGGKGVLNTDRPQDLPSMMLRTKNEEFEGSMRAKENGILPHKPVKGGMHDTSDDDDEDEDEVDLSEMNAKQLREYAEENDIELPAGKKSAASLLALIEAAQAEDDDEDEEDEEDDDEDEDEDEEDDEEEVDLDELDLKGLKAFAKEQDIDISGVKGTPKIRAAIQAALEEGDDEEDEEDEEDEDEAEDYTTWSIPQLKKELKSRNLPVAGTQKALAKRLTESDESDPFEDE